LDAAAMLEKEGIQARVINMATVKPIDREAIVEAAVETGGIVTAEEHTIYGGFGGAVAEVVATSHPVPMRMLGVPGVFAPTGSPEFLLEHFNLTPEGIRDAALDVVRSRGS
jgi:transketolase